MSLITIYHDQGAIADLIRIPLDPIVDAHRPRPLPAVGRQGRRRPRARQGQPAAAMAVAVTWTVPPAPPRRPRGVKALLRGEAGGGQ